MFPEGSGGVVTVDLEVSKNDVIQFSVDGSQQLFSGLTGLKITAHGTIGSAPDTGIFIE